MRRTAFVRVTALVIVASVVLAAAAAFVSFASGGDGGDDGERVDLSPATTTTLGPGDLALAALLPAGPVGGMTRALDDLGALDVATAADNFPFGDPSGQRLDGYGFRRGVARTWESADDRTLYAVIYELDDAAGWHRSWEEVADPLATARFPTPVGEGITDATPESRADLVAWVDGDRWYYVVHFGPPDGPGEEPVRAMVTALGAG
jgi:hypothetical protein